MQHVWLVNACFDSNLIKDVPIREKGTVFSYMITLAEEYHWKSYITDEWKCTQQIITHEFFCELERFVKLWHGYQAIALKLIHF